MFKMKKFLSILLCLVFAISILSGCGGTSSNQPAKSADTEPAKSTAGEPAKTEKKDSGASSTNEKVKLKILHYLTSEREFLKATCNDFNKSQDKIDVSEEFVPFPDLKKQLSISVAGGKSFDIVCIDNADNAAFAAAGFFADITDKINSWPDKDKIFDGQWISTVYKDKTYGIPMQSNCLVMFYNEDMLKAASLEVPKTWDELKAAAKKLTKKGVYGFGVSSPASEEGTFQFYPWLMSAGGSFKKLDSPESIKALKLWDDMVKEGSISLEVLNWNQNDIANQFSAGKYAMIIDGPWVIPLIKKNNPGFKWNVALIPSDKKPASVAGGENIAIFKGKHENESWEFIQYFFKKDNYDKYIQPCGKYPTRKDSTQAPAFTNDPITKVFMDEMQYAVPRGPHPKWPELSEPIYTAIQQALTDKKSPEDAMKEAQAKVDKILAQDN